MSTFQYDRINGTPEKREQSSLQNLSKSVDRKLMAKLLDFVNRI